MCNSQVVVFGGGVSDVVMRLSVLLLLSPLLALAECAITKIAFGSCNKQSYGGLWWQMAEKLPDYLVLLGDNVYNDVRSRSGQWQPASEEAINKSYEELRSDEGWRTISNQLGRNRIFATWDDHDYGLDNGDRTFINKKASLKSFLEFFHHDASDYNLRMQRGGVYKADTISLPREGQKDFVLKIIMLDSRYFKDPKGSSNADILGPDQWLWLENQLSFDKSGDSIPDLILLGSSIQVLPTQKIFEETWSSYPHSRQRLLSLLAQSPCPNIFILSGDVHMMEVSQAHCQHGESRKNIIELTSSGLSQTFSNYIKKPLNKERKEPTVILKKGFLLQYLYDAYEASYPARYRENKYKDFYQNVHFSILSIDLSLQQPKLQFDVVNHDGGTAYSRVLPLVPAVVGGEFNDTEKMDYECTPFWGPEKSFDYFVHLFCMASVIFVTVIVPVFVVLWLVFASFYYIWFISEEKRRERLMKLHKKTN